MYICVCELVSKARDRSQRFGNKIDGAYYHISWCVEDTIFSQMLASTRQELYDETHQREASNNNLSELSQTRPQLRSHCACSDEPSPRLIQSQLRDFQIKNDMNRVLMARNGLVLGKDRATAHDGSTRP